MTDETKAVEIFEQMGHLVCEEDIILTSEHIIDFETQITGWLKKKSDFIGGCRTMEIEEAVHSSGKTFDYFVLIDLGMKRAVLSL